MGQINYDLTYLFTEGIFFDSSELASSSRVIIFGMTDNVVGVSSIDEISTFLGSNGLIASSLIDAPSGVPGLNADGDLVRDIRLINHANAAAAGVPPIGTLLCIDGKLYISDGVETGGNRVVGATPGFFSVTTTGDITLDPFSCHAFISVAMENSSIVITITNIDDLPLGYVLFLYVNKNGTADQITIQGPSGAVNILDAFVVGSTLSSLTIARKSTAATFGWEILQNTSV